jgi:glycosyltransferase involved in cell wall biosynthesis
MANVLYITQDGITDHIGQAQIAPYLLGLAQLGHAIHIVSAEKPGREALTGHYQALFNHAGIRWTSVPYRNQPPLISSAWTLWSMWRAVLRVADASRPDLIHCRSYLPLELAARAKRRYGVKYLADFRDFWADVGMETKRFRWVYRIFLKREPAALDGADHVVTLTHRAADMLIARHPHVAKGMRGNYTVIPCCADFNLFDPARVDPCETEERRSQLDIPETAPVMLYLGSLGSDYLLGPMMKLFRELRMMKNDAVFVFLANNGWELVQAEAAKSGVPVEALRFTSAERRNVPAFLAFATVSPVFIRPTLSKAGCSPTKVAELFAMNVPIIANSGYGDIDEIVSPEKNGSVVVSDFTAETLRTALKIVLSKPNRSSIREASGAFSLEEGVRRYDRIYRMLSGRCGPVDAPAALEPAC